MFDYILIDCGGTKTALQICRVDLQIRKKTIKREPIVTLRNSDYSSFYDLLDVFFAARPLNQYSFQAVLVAGAGKISDGSITLTNLDWNIDRAKLQSRFFTSLSPDQIHLFNDLEAAAWFPLSKEIETYIDTIHQVDGTSKNGHYLMLAVGTGFGTALGIYDPKTQSYIICPGEGGHVSFSAASTRQQELLHYYRQMHPEQEITFEYFLSGAGLSRLYQFQTGGGIKKAEDISDGAAKGCADCLATIDLFFEILAAAAKNLALITIPTKGIYITGGIPVHLANYLDKKTFANRFTQSEKMNTLLTAIPVYLVKNHNAPIEGLVSFVNMNL